jgi:hypothetical protein
MAIFADSESKAKIMLLLIGIFMGLIAGQLAWDRSEKHPGQVFPVGDRVIVIIREYGKSAYVYTIKKGHFEFEEEFQPNSPYYPMPLKEIAGHKEYFFNPKFNEWVADWERKNKVD